MTRRELRENVFKMLFRVEFFDAGELSEQLVLFGEEVDLALIRLAVYEIRYDDEIPFKVAVNEAVELAKQYGTNDSPAFVNGILAKFAE